MPIAAILGFLAANPGLIMAVPGAVTSLIDLVKAVISNPETPEDVKAQLEQWSQVLAEDEEAVLNAPVPK